MSSKNSAPTLNNKSKLSSKKSMDVSRKNSVKSTDKIDNQAKQQSKQKCTPIENGNNNNNRFSREKSLPQTKIRHMMECAPSGEEHIKISWEAVNAMARAAEAFAESLAQGAYEQATRSGHKLVDYNDLSQSVNSNEKLSFIHDILPMKLTYSDVLRKMRKQRKRQLQDEQQEKNK